MPSTPTRRSAFALALITLFTATTACEKAPAKAFVPPPAQVGIVTVAPATIPEAYEFVGQVSPFRRVEVRSRVEGIITEAGTTEDGKRFENARRFTDTWKLRDGQWKAVSSVAEPLEANE